MHADRQRLLCTKIKFHETARRQRQRQRHRKRWKSENGGRWRASIEENSPEMQMKRVHRIIEIFNAATW